MGDGSRFHVNLPEWSHRDVFQFKISNSCDCYIMLITILIMIEKELLDHQDHNRDNKIMSISASSSFLFTKLP